MSIRLLALIVALGLSTTALGQGKPRIEKAADLPRFTYKIDGSVEDVIRDDAKFRRFAADVRRDAESVLNGYQIDDRATLRQIEGELTQLDYLDGNLDSALKRAARVRELQEKPADKLMSGLQLRAMIGAQRKVGNRTSDAYRAETGRLIDADLAQMPYDVVQNEVKEAKASAEIASEALTLGYCANGRPADGRQGRFALSSDLAPILVSARYRLTASLPLKATLIDTYSRYLAAHKVDKPDIWAARDVAARAAARPWRTVNVAVWDGGRRHGALRRSLVKDGEQAGRDRVRSLREARRRASCSRFPPSCKDRIPQMKSRLKGFSDLQSNIDSPEASEVKQYLSSLKPDEYKRAFEELGLAGNWMHGTHVAGITMAGNPYARLVTGRIEFDWHMLPDPCPTRELAERDARNQQAYVDFFKQHGVRVVNMSWGGSVKGIEEQLELCNIGSDARRAQEDRARLLRDPEGRADEGVRQRARHPVRHRGRQQQRGCVVRRGHSGRHRAAEPDDGRRRRQGRRRSVVHELRADGRRARERLPGRKRDPRRRQARRIGNVDGVAAGREPRGEDPRGQSEAHAARGDQADPRHRRQDAGRPPHARQSEEGAAEACGSEVGGVTPSLRAHGSSARHDRRVERDAGALCSRMQRERALARHAHARSAGPRRRLVARARRASPSAC